MKKGFLATLFALTVSFFGIQSASAIAPVITGIPDQISIGDLEDNGNNATDNNFFQFTNTFRFADAVQDSDSTGPGQLLWSFAEFNNPDPAGLGISATDNQFQVNGKNPILEGDVAIANDQAAGYMAAKAVTPANAINDQPPGGAYAHIRNIVLSPPPGNGPFAEPTQAQKNAAALGKVVRFYVTDQNQNVATKDIIVKTVDDSADAVSQSFVPLIEDKGFSNGWSTQGIAWAPAAATATASGELRAVVQTSSQKSRIVGWSNVAGVPYSSIGTGKYLRTKWYVYTGGQSSAAVNNIPGLRIRLYVGDAMVSVNEYEYATTGQTGPSTAAQNQAFGGSVYNILNNPQHEQYSDDYAPSKNASKPSLYRVDMDPVDVPALTGRNISIGFLSYTFHDPSNGFLALTEAVAGTYPALSNNAGTVRFDYTPGAAGIGWNGPASGNTAPGFAAENEFAPGYKQTLFIPGVDTGEVYATATSSTVTGVTLDTPSNVNQNRFVVATVNLQNNNVAARAEMAEGKLYKTRFHATATATPNFNVSDTAVKGQGTVRFRVQAALATFSSRLELPQNNSGDASDRNVWAEAVPGTLNKNPEKLTNENNGGWYNVITPSLLDGDIRADVNGAITTKMPQLAGPVNSQHGDYKDIIPGVDIIKNAVQITVNGSPFPFVAPNRPDVTVDRIQVLEYNQIQDGGYAY